MLVRTQNTSRFYSPKIKKVSVIIEDTPNQLYAQGMRRFEQYDEICKFFAEGKQRDANTSEVQKHLQLHDLRVREYLTYKYAFWFHFRMTDRNALHGSGRRRENASEGITLQIEKDAEVPGNLNTYIYLIMDAQLNIKDEAFVSARYQEMLTMTEPHTVLFVAGVGKHSWPYTCSSGSTLIISTVLLFSAPFCNTTRHTANKSGFGLILTSFL